MPTLTPLTERALSRRALLRGTAVAGGAVFFAGLTPAAAEAAVKEASATPFGFGVASGDPRAHDVLLWTRVTPDPTAVPGSGLGAATVVTWELSAVEAFTTVLRSGTVTSDPASDHTIKVVVDGLAVYTRYFYRFRALEATSPVGRTQTAPDEAGVTHALRFAFVSCSNYTGGYFTAYRGVAARDDLDFVLHLGDYIYEYGNGADRYGPASLAGKRDHEPPTEPFTLPSYRTRYALYRTDPDLAEAHRRHPWIVIFDDHEVCDNTYDTGAVNHQPDTEGDFAARRAMAYQAYLEWLPIRLPEQSGAVGTRFWRRFSFGDLADLSVLETRQNRSMQVASSDTAALADPARHLPEPQQLTWLTDQLTSSTKTWSIVGNQVVLARVYSAPRANVVPGTIFNADQWDGYQADQSTLIAAMGKAKAAAGATDPVVLTGDIHSSWANDLPAVPDTAAYRASNNAVGVEFVCPSITSDGFKEVLGGNAATAIGATTAFMNANPWIRFLDGVGHGFAVLDVTPDRVQADFHYIRSPDAAGQPDYGLTVDPRVDPAATTAFMFSSVSTKDSNRITSAPTATAPGTPVGTRSDQPRVASDVPPTDVPDGVGALAVAGVVGAGALYYAHQRRTAAELA